jgi:hypothetical protein
VNISFVDHLGARRTLAADHLPLSAATKKAVEDLHTFTARLDALQAPAAAIRLQAAGGADLASCTERLIEVRVETELIHARVERLEHDAADGLREDVRHAIIAAIAAVERATSEWREVRDKTRATNAADYGKARGKNVSAMLKTRPLKRAEKALDDARDIRRDLELLLIHLDPTAYAEGPGKPGRAMPLSHHATVQPNFGANCAAVLRTLAG